jgi:pyridoxal phosphate enzyme (YggS family)
MKSKSEIENSYFEIIGNINGRAKLLAVSKYQPISAIKILSDIGCKDFGENYLQELEIKFAEMPDLNWHFIGSIQSRKIKNIVKCASTIHSVASIKHLEMIDMCARSISKTVDVFLQINIDNDTNKSGFCSDESNKIFECIACAQNMLGVRVVGLMCLPAKMDSSLDSFVNMKILFDYINSQLDEAKQLKQLSMGMSSDYVDAIEHGSTIVRVGSSIFGPR